MRAMLLATGFLFLLPAAAFAQGVHRNGHPKVDQNKVDGAIDRGAEYLLQKVESGLPTSGEHVLEKIDYPLDEIVLFTLIHAGNRQDDSRFQRLAEKVADAPVERTYTVVLKAMALQALDPDRYQDNIAQCGIFLVNTQCENGQWSYGQPPEIPDGVPTGDKRKAGMKEREREAGGTRARDQIRLRRWARGPEKGDNSNSQYAALGIRACMEADVQIPYETMRKAVEWWEKNQKQDGSWDYGTDDPDPSEHVGMGSMTAGAVASLAICYHYLRKDVPNSEVLQRGISWMDRSFSVTTNPGRNAWHFYWLYALERAGMLYGTESTGSHEWYVEGAEWLLTDQNGDGSWQSKAEKPWSSKCSGGAVVDTCFAILFLRRATRPLEKVATGGRQNKAPKPRKEPELPPAEEPKEKPGAPEEEKPAGGEEPAPEKQGE